MNKIETYFSSKLASIMFVCLAIANRIIFTSLHSFIGSDPKIQLTYAENLVAGKGMGVAKYFTTDLNTLVYDTHQWFPPGFSLTIIPFLKLSGGNEFTAVLAFDILSAILFILAVRLLGKSAGLPAGLNNIVILIAGTSQYIFFMSWSSTDAIGLCFVLFAFAETIRIIKKREDIGVLRMIGCGILFCLPFFFRYMYLPIAVLLPVLIFLFGVFSKTKKLKTTGLKIFFFSVFILSLLFVFSLSVSGNALFVHNVGRGFYFNQLVHWYPFLPASFINIDFAAQLTEKYFNMEYSRMINFLNILNLVFLVLLLVSLYRYIISNKKSLLFVNHFICITVGSAISISVILLLAYLSLTYKELTWGHILWTHVQHARYFAFLFVFIPLLFFISLHYYTAYFKRPVMRILVIIIMCCMATDVIHGFYYNTKIILSSKGLDYVREADKGYRSFPAFMAEIKKQYPDREIYVCSPDQYYLNDASKNGYKAIFDFENLWSADLIVKTKILLIVPVHKQEAPIMKKYIDNKKPQLVSDIAGTYFYKEEINPE